MAGISAGTAYVDVSPRLDGFGRELTAKMKGIGSKLAGAAKAGIAIGGAAAIGGLAAIVKTGIGEFSDYQKGLAQAQAVIKSTGGVAGVTAGHLEEMASALQDQTGATDDSIVASENLLLTFTNIQNKVGKGNDIFDQATSAILDMSQALGQDTKSSAIQLGKALNDPIKGVTALRRVGVSFNESQIKTIKTLVKSGKTLEAQKFILAELNKEFGGSAKAFGQTLPGKIARAKRAFEDMSQTIVGAVAPAFADIAVKATGFLKDLGRKAGPAIDAIRRGFAGRPGEENFFTRLGESARDLFDFLKNEVAPFISHAMSVVFGTLGKVIKALIPPLTEVGHFIAKTLFPVLRGIWEVTLVVIKAFGELIKRLSGPLKSAFRSINKAFDDHREQIDKVVKFIQGLVKVIVKVLVPVLSFVLGNAIRIAGKVIGFLIDAIAFLIDAFTNVKKAVGGAIDFMKKVIVSGIQIIVNTFLAMAGFIVHAAATAFGWIPGIGGKLKAADKAFKDFRERVNAELDKIKNPPKKFLKVELLADPAVKKLLAAPKGTVLTIADIGHFAEGGIARGWAVVGERGPELAYFGAPTKIISNEDIRSADATPATRQGDTINVTINNPKAEPASSSMLAARKRMQLMVAH